MTDKANDFEVAIQRTPKVRPIVELGKPNENITLSDAVDYVLKTDFDPGTTTYEFPVLDQKPLTYDSLRQLSGCNKYEISIVSIFENDKWATRVMTGDQYSCGTSTLFPFNSDKDRDFDGNPIVTLKSPRGYPILDDEGNFTGKPWSIDIHNHPTTTFEGPPYPSMPDIANGATKAETAILVSKYGLTVYGPAGTDLRLPDELKAKIHERTPQEFIKNSGNVMEINRYLDQQNLTPQKGVAKNEPRWIADKLICDIVDTKVKVLEWDKDRKQIEKILSDINDRVFDSREYLSKNADEPISF